MATSSDTGASTPAGSTTRTTKATARRKPATARKTTTTSRRSTRSRSTSTQPKTRVAQAQQLAERAVLVPVGAGLVARDNFVSSAKGFASRYRTRAGLEREIKRYERRGATARNRFERQVRKTRTQFERELRQRRSTVERTVKQNLGRPSGVFGPRFEKLVTNAQELLTSAR